MADMKKESETAGDASETSVAGLFKIAGIRWQLFTLIFMHIAQPMSGINAVFFYSNQIFEAIGIEKSKLATYSIYLRAWMTKIEPKLFAPKKKSRARNLQEPFSHAP